MNTSPLPKLPPPRFVNLSTLARCLGVPLAFLKRLHAAGELPCLRVRNSALFDVEQTKAALLERAQRGDGGER